MGALLVQHGGVEDPPIDGPVGLDDLDAQTARCAIDAGHVPLHAASVEIGTGVVVFAGPSGSGKSTLCAAGVQSGHRYVADEVTAIDPETLRVVPYLRPIGIRSGGADALGIEFPEGRRSLPNAVHLTPVEPSLHSTGGALLGIFLIAWRPGATESMTIGRPTALTELTQHLLVDSDDDLFVGFRGLDLLVRTVPIVRLTYGDPLDGLSIVEAQVASWTS
jgi:hypothetical protein